MSLTLRAKLALLCGIPIGGLILTVTVSSSLAKVTSQRIGHAKDESAVFAAVALNMQREVVQVQQWLTDISATRGQDGLADGFDKGGRGPPRVRLRPRPVPDDVQERERHGRARACRRPA